jgi:DNA-binding LacI/PurR family transcriptional regulator
VSAVGFDDMDKAADFWPPLTTVRQAFGDVARHAVTALLAEIAGDGTGHTVTQVGTELIVRSSTAPPPTVRPVA